MIDCLCTQMVASCLALTVWLCGVRVFEALSCQNEQSQFVYSYFLFLRQSSKTNWRCCNEALRLNYPLNPALHIAFVTAMCFIFSCQAHHYKPKTLLNSFSFIVILFMYKKLICESLTITKPHFSNTLMLGILLRLTIAANTL